jgi:TfoX/Sxy family transcriptional regulator of competence genes
VPDLSHRKMFGEYAIYVGDRVVALVADDQFFVKKTDAGRALLSSPTEAPPYPGASPHLLIGGELDDRELMTTLINTTVSALPPAKPKKKKSKGK